MEFNKYVLRIVVAAFTLAIVQGLVWIILCLLGIFVHFGTWTPTPDATSYYGSTLVSIFAYQKTKMIVLLIVYLLLSLMWISISITLIISFRRKQNYKTQLTLLIWGGWTILICLYDVIVVGILAYDYQEASDTPIAYAILFSIAARGYVLWCVNLIFAIIVVKHAKNSIKNDADSYNNLINAFGEESRRRSSEPNGNLNYGFDWESSNRPSHHQSNSLPSFSQENDVNKLQPPNVPVKPNYNNRETELGTHSNAYSQNVRLTINIFSKPYPKIPMPDYTPPNSPVQSVWINKLTEDPFILPRIGNGTGRY